MVEIEIGSRIPIWRTFGLIQWHAIHVPRAILHGKRIQSAILKIFFAVFFLFS